MTFRFDSAQANSTTFTDGPLSFPANCSSTSQTNFFIQLDTDKQTTVYTEGVFAQNSGAATPNLNSILCSRTPQPRSSAMVQAEPNSTTRPC